jgi:hypothetical protein
VKPPQRYQAQGLWVEACGGGFNACYRGSARWFANRADLVAWLKWPKGPSKDALNTWLDEIEAPAAAAEAVEQDPTANTRTII